MKYVSLLLFFLLGCKSERVQLSGEARMVGNAPFEHLALISEGKSYQFSAEDEKKYKHLNGKSVTFFGQIEVKQITSANEKYTFDVFYLITDSLKVN